MKVLIPEYLENFQCIGSACEDTCCIGWNVIIDEKTNSKYRKILGSRYKSIIQKNRSGNKEYKIKLNDKLECPLLTEEKLCSIHADFGYSYLSETCKFYPRITNLVFDSYEQSATLSCPEIARLALSNPDGINFKEININIEQQAPNLNIKNNTKSKILLNTFWDIRIFCIQILKSREYSIDERLMTIGLFLNGIDNLTSEYEIKKRIDEFNREFDNFNIKKSIEIFPDNRKLVQINALNLIIYGKKYSVNNIDFINLLKDATDSYGFSFEDLIKNIPNEFIPKYESSIKSYKSVFESKLDYILENYLINEIFKELFPLSKYDNILNSYINIVTKFVTIRTILIGLNIKEPISEETIITFIQKFSKTITHDDLFQKAIIEFILKLEYNPIAFSMAMLKI